MLASKITHTHMHLLQQIQLHSNYIKECYCVYCLSTNIYFMYTHSHLRTNNGSGGLAREKEREVEASDVKERERKQMTDTEPPFCHLRNFQANNNKRFLFFQLFIPQSAKYR